MADLIGNITTETLDAFADAFNRHDADAVMSFMTDDCVFEASAGPEVCGTRYAGREAVRAAFADVFATFPTPNGAGRGTSSRAIEECRSGRSPARVALTRRASKCTAATCYLSRRQNRSEEVLPQESSPQARAGAREDHG